MHSRYIPSTSGSNRPLSWLATVLLAVIIAPAAGVAQEPSDDAITGAVEDELDLDEAVALNNLDVQTDDGVVTLSGKVTNLLARERAARIAETVRGVRSVVNRIKVVPTPDRSDAGIQDDVRDALRMDPATEQHEIAVSVSDGDVTLAGTVESWPARRLCERIAKGVRGVDRVVNDIEVDYAVQRADDEIEAEILRRLQWDSLVDHRDIDVAVNNARVTLTGTVGRASERRRAATDAWIAGVKHVDASDLKVKQSARAEDLRKRETVSRSESELRRAIEDAFRQDPRVHAPGVQVQVSGSVVTLRGRVDYLKAKRAAAQDARHTVGVSSVRNRLKVRPNERIKDDVIAMNVRAGLRRDPYVERREIRVTVEDGIVKLAGAVDSHFEKALADDVASRVPGVLAIRNQLTADRERYLADPYVDEWFIYDRDWYNYQPRTTLMRSDADLQADIEQKLWWSPMVDANRVEVIVTGGVARLTGVVDSSLARRRAAAAALKAGAREVKNHLRVR